MPYTDEVLNGNPASLDIYDLLSTIVPTAPDEAKRLKIALLSDSASQFLAKTLRALFWKNGVFAETYESGFDTIEMEVLDKSSRLHAFKPDFIIVANSTQALREKFLATEAHDGEVFAREETEKMKVIWERIAANSGARVIQLNLAMPVERFFGNYDRKTSDSFTQVVASINQGVSALAAGRGDVFILDIEHLSSWHGRRLWFDDRLWHMTKTFCAMEMLPHVAQAAVDICMAALQRTVKCVAFDLDETIWGGVVGDDGLEGIELGTDGLGEAFLALQKYLRRLKSRGIALAVCSKNSEAQARALFRQHPRMVLRESDIAVFIANWENKADNLRAIQKTLGIGLDSMVFIDDSPFERNLVRQLLPEVIVPELPDDPSEYVKALSEYNLFETASYTDEDKRRADGYFDEVSRRELQKSFSSLDDYLKSLGMVAQVQKFEARNLERIAQLIQRSNQFNLTTRRYGVKDCERIILNSKDCHPFSISLKDKFGDYGLIGVVIVKFEGSDARIDTFLMSCRVLSRGVEALAMNRVFELARERKCKHVVGEFIPTEKNDLVKDFYRSFGFEPEQSKNDATVLWRKELASYVPHAVHIRA